MNYEESITYIESLFPTLERPTLARIKAFMRDQGDIQNSIKTFHVGGTNGKGSTATILDALLSSQNLKVGRFTGPHIMRFNERFSIAGQAIDNLQFARIATVVREKSEAFAARYEDLGKLTWFEFLTAMAFFAFQESRVDCVVLEVGLGGRFDATNIVDNVLATILTNIDLDHMHILGDTVTKIAFEKAGIMRKGVPIITCARGEALEQLKKSAEATETRLIRIPEDKQEVFSSRQASLIERALDSLSLAGPHQRENATMAIAAVMLSKLITDEKSFFDGLSDCLHDIYFAGRMQKLPAQGIIMDGAHNPAGARALRKALGEKKRVFIVGFYGNKDVAAFLKELLHKGDRVVAVQADVRRATFPREQIAAICEELAVEAHHADSMEEALALARQSDPEGEIVVTGSFAIIKEMMMNLGWKSVDAAQCRERTYPAVTNK